MSLDKPSAGRRFIAGLISVLALGLVVAFVSADKADLEEISTGPQLHQPSDPPDLDANLASPKTRAMRMQLEARLLIDPGDLEVRRRLALSLLETKDFMMAYEHASAVLDSSTNDPDGLYVHAVVRLAMGQPSRAITSLEHLLSNHPDHEPALEALAKAQGTLGDLRGAALSRSRIETARQKRDLQTSRRAFLATADSPFPMARGSATAPPRPIQKLQ